LLDLHSLYQIIFQELLMLAEQSQKEATSCSLTRCTSLVLGQEQPCTQLAKWASLSF